jgi:hypothetical protein
MIGLALAVCAPGCRRGGPARAKPTSDQAVRDDAHVKESDEGVPPVRGREPTAQGMGADSGPVLVTTGRTHTVRDARLPIEYYPSRGVKVQIRADQATMLESGEIIGTRAKLDLFDESGDREGLGTVATCRYDRVKGVLTSSCPVAFDARTAWIRGTGLEFRTREQIVIVQSNVTVTLTRRLMKDHGLKKRAE